MKTNTYPLTPAHAIARINAHIEKEQAKLTKWANENLAQNPSSAFSWSKDQFDIAAKIDVLSQVSYTIEFQQRDDEVLTIKLVREWCTNRALREARSIASMSSSPTSNVMDLYKLQAWASFADTWSDMRDALEDSLRDNPDYVATLEAYRAEENAKTEAARRERDAHNAAVKSARAKARRLERDGKPVPADVAAKAKENMR